MNHAEFLHYFCCRNTNGNQLLASAINVQCGLFTKASSKNTRLRTTVASAVFLVHLLIPLCLVMHVFGCMLTSKEMNCQSQQKFLFFQKFSVCVLQHVSANFAIFR